MFHLARQDFRSLETRNRPETDSRRAAGEPPASGLFAAEANPTVEAMLRIRELDARRQAGGSDGLFHLY